MKKFNIYSMLIGSLIFSILFYAEKLTVAQGKDNELTHNKSFLSGVVVSSIATKEVILPPFDLARYPKPFQDLVDEIRQKAYSPTIYQCKGDASFSVQVLKNSIIIDNKISEISVQNISDNTDYFEFRNKDYYIVINKFDTSDSTEIYFENLETNKVGSTVCDDFTLRLFDMVDAPSDVIKELDKYNMKPGYFISLKLQPVNPKRDALTLRPDPIVTEKNISAINQVKSAIAKHNPKPWNYYGIRTAEAIASCKAARARGAIVNGGIGC
jgi:hypothetical protein